MQSDLLLRRHSRCDKFTRQLNFLRTLYDVIFRLMCQTATNARALIVVCFIHRFCLYAKNTAGPTSATKMERTRLTGTYGHSSCGTWPPKGSGGLSFVFETYSPPCLSKRLTAAPLPLMTSVPLQVKMQVRPASQILETLISGLFISAT